MKPLCPLRSAHFALVLALSFLVISGCGGGGGGPDTYTITTLKGDDWQSYVGQEVIVEGIFVMDPVPMIVTDINLLLMNTPMPDDKYILLTGDEVAKIDVEENGGAKLRINGVVNAIDPKLSDEKVAIGLATYERIKRDFLYNPRIRDFDFTPGVFLKSRHAVLFSGGINSSKNYVRYWNDLKFMYGTLVDQYGFNPDNITVLFADGTGRDADMPVDFSATQAHLETAFADLKETTDQYDLIFFFMTNHGGGFYEATATPNWYGGKRDTEGDEGAEGILESDYGIDFDGDGSANDSVSWDEELCSWGGHIYDDAFIDILDDGLNYSHLIIVMEQCFSAGLILDMAQGGDDRIIMAAAGQYEPSWAMAPDYEYNEFSYWFTSAINGAEPDGTAVDADADDDGEASMVEAFNYARSHDTASESPHYEDSGDGIAHTSAMPSSGDGVLGADVSLH